MTINHGTALITGASSGLGAIYADRLAHRGYDLILVARDAARMHSLADRLRAETGRAVDVLPADLTDRAGVATVEARFASDTAITLFVNNAGMSLTGNLLNTDIGRIEALLALNVVAPTLLARAAALAFVSRKAGGIINLSSVLAYLPDIYDGVYSGSKAFVLNLSQSLATLLEPQGIRVQALLPGATRTEIWERAGMDANAIPADRVMDADDLVDAALIGFDRGETVTIPPLADESEWTRMNDARLAMGPHLSRRDVAPRYRMEALS